MKLLFDYTDENGLIVQKNGDGGDSLNRTSIVATLKFWCGEFAWSEFFGKAIVGLADKGMFKYRRSVHPGKWYSNFDRTSRDQLSQLLIFYGVLAGAEPRIKLALRWIFLDHLKRGLLFTYNTRRNFQYPTLAEHLEKSTPDVKWNYGWKLPDLTGPEFWALYIRGFGAWYLYPLLYMFDLETLLASVVLRFQPKKDDVINHAMVLEFAKTRMDTFVMKLARWINPRSFLAGRVDKFFGVDQEPPINEIYRNLK